MRPAPQAFLVRDTSIGGLTHPAILARESTRIVFRADVPPRAALEVSVGVPEEAWPLPSDGVLLRILLARGETEGPMQYYVRHLNPHRNRMDRGWQDVTLDLAPFAGERVRVFLNTNYTPRAGADPGGPTPGLGAWGKPRIVAR
jgi:hypothetical protein